MLKISIPKPCHEDWDKMTPTDHGRHCAACAKTVTDFTVMSDEEIKYFFINRKSENTCGRFTGNQLHRITITLPQNIFRLQIPAWKQFLAACLLAFSATLFSCDTIVGHTKGEPEISNTLGVIMPPITDSSIHERAYVGGIGIVTDSIPPPACSSIRGEVQVVEVGYTQGVTIIYDSAQITPIVEVAPEPAPIIKPVDSSSNTLMGDTIIIKTPDSLKTKNQPKADSIICDNESGIIL